jgi:hypothetical protein
LRAVLDQVARERVYLMLLEAPPTERIAAFISSILETGGVQILAVTPDNEVVG